MYKCVYTYKIITTNKSIRYGALLFDFNTVEYDIISATNNGIKDSRLEQVKLCIIKTVPKFTNTKIEFELELIGVRLFDKVTETTNE